ncbi:4'-phosphopantetheinyl transferase family protein [Cryobacterium sp. AP23]
MPDAPLPSDDPVRTAATSARAARAGHPGGDPADTEPAGIDLAGTDLAGTVVVLLAGQAPMKAGDHRLLAALVGRVTGADAASVTVSQECPSCGEPGHGPLRVLVGTAAPSPAVHVSLARAGGLVALAVTGAGPVGIDLESVAALRRAPVGDALVSAAEALALAGLGASEAEAATGVLWTSKEAVLKAAGVGLRVDPRDLTIALPAPDSMPAGGSADRAADSSASRSDVGDSGPSARPRVRWPVVAEWPAAPFPLDAVHLHPLTAPPGTVGTVAVVCAARPALVVLPAPLS